MANSCECTLFLLAFAAIGALIYWIIDAWTHKDEFNQINPWLGWWNLGMSLWWIISTALIPFFLVQLDRYPRRCFLYLTAWTMQVLSVIALYAGVVIFYMIVPMNWSKFSLSYQIGWCVIMTPASLVAAGGVICLFM
jgi:hypothetical protein